MSVVQSVLKLTNTPLKYSGTTQNPITMVKALWNGSVLAESDKTEVVEGNHYFPPESVNWDYFKPSATNSVCPWKGVASYHNLVVEGQVNEDAVWYYPEPSAAAERIKNHVAFWKGVEIVE